MIIYINVIGDISDLKGDSHVLREILRKKSTEIR